MPRVPNQELVVALIPPAKAGWDVISRFALLFDGYERWGSFERCAEIANARNPQTLDEYRTCLFFEQRRWRHLGEEPDEEAMVYIRTLVDGIRRFVATR